MAGGDKRIRIEKDEVDRISELPVDLREHILDFLSLKDAVSTSVLSTKWRYCWTGLRKLNFNGAFWNGMASMWLSHISVIDRVLMLHSGHIREFILYIQHAHMDISAWLRVLSNKGVKKIDIDAYQLDEKSFRIPSCLFHCQELKELSLCNFKLKLPSDFRGFANLISLSLDTVDLDPSLLESLLSGSPLLERLSLVNMEFQKPFALEALNLKNFFFEDYCLQNITVKDVPKLTSITLLVNHSEIIEVNIPQPCNTFDLLCSLSNLEELTYDLRLLEPLSESCPSVAPTPLVNLKSLTVKSLDPSFSQDVLFTLCLIRSAPNLQHLTVYDDSKFWGDYETEEMEEAVKLLESEATKNGVCNILQTIKIKGVEMPRHEILLLELFKKCCRKLKSIVIEKGD